MSGCGSTSPSLQKTSGSKSAIFSLDSLMNTTATAGGRKSSLLGVFVSEYVSTSPNAQVTQSGVKGITVQTGLATAGMTVTDPDFDLLQAFGDALQVNVPDLLNRSNDRAAALDAYSTALTNVATRGNQRYNELSSTLEQLKTQLSVQGRERSTAESDLNKAIKKKDFTAAGEQQKLVLEKQQAYAETDLKKQQIENVVSTLKQLLSLYSQKIVVIQQNREVLIAGNKVVNVPGIEEFKLIEKGAGTNTRGSFDSLFKLQ